MDVFDINYEKEQKGFFSNILSNSPCYPWDDFKIIGYPLLGTYDDYGTYVFDDKEMADLNLSIINDIYIPNKKVKGKNNYNEIHDHLDIEKIEDFDQLQAMQNSGALRVKTVNGTSIVTKMAIHEDIFQELILGSKYKIEMSGKNVSFDEALQKYNKQMKENLQKLNDYKYNEKIKKATEQLTDKNNDSQETIKRMEEILRSIDFDKLVINKSMSDPYLKNTPVNEHLIEKEFKDSILESWCQIVWTAKWFLEYNYQFLPVILSGQEVDYSSHIGMLNKMQNIISDLEKDDMDYLLIINQKYEKKQELSLSEIDKKMNEWFSNFDKDNVLKDYKELKEYIKDKDINYFTIGEDSLIANFFDKYELLDYRTRGVIYIVD